MKIAVVGSQPKKSTGTDHWQLKEIPSWGKRQSQQC